MRIEVASGRFLAQLSERLLGAELVLPPLRQRPEDLPRLIHRFLLDLGQVSTSFHPTALDALLAYSWPGNVAELEEVVRVASSMGPGEVIDLDALPEEVRAASRAPLPPRSEFTAGQERGYYAELLRRTKGNISETSRLAGEMRSTTQRQLKILALKPDAFR